MLTACSSTTASTSGSTPASSGAQGSGNAQIDAAVAKHFKGTLRQPDGTARPAAKGKKIVVISNGQASISSSIPSNAAAEAAKAIGWQATIYDGQLNPSKADGLVRQAVNSGADGIVLDAIDCPLAKSALQEAKARGIKVVPIYAYDCNDPIYGGTDAPLFNGIVNYGPEAAKDIDQYTRDAGAAQADAVIYATHGHAKVIAFNDPEVTVLRYTNQGFLDEIAKCSGCQVVAKVDFLGAELGPALQQKVSTVLLQHPEANAVKSPFTAASLLGISPAVVQAGRTADIYVMGGEGFQPELDLLRNDHGINAVNLTPSDWTGWAAVDSLNSFFLGQQPADSGLGQVLVDKNHNLPASGPYIPSIDFKAAYKKAWQVG
ncbi:MAG TPA: substrate-binding domain-containing protein [Candidatus Dormibacteraeota bacterium]|nr:substrate-binding domain-containing protein [Candidatus Dormibacteraeota bacterium]